MKITCVLIFWGLLVIQLHSQTDVSLFFRADSSRQISEVSSEDGDLFLELGHHGPAIENSWMGLRMYFDHKCAIDVYSKAKEGLELAEAKWYPTIEQQQQGWGADYYKAGSSLGLGGIRLWDGEGVVKLDPVSKRIARVVKGVDSSYLEMQSEGVPYKNGTADILVRVMVFSSMRKAKVEAFVLSDEPVQFITGINYHKTTKVYEGANYIATWGLHPEDVAAKVIEIGGAILYNPKDFTKIFDMDGQRLLLSKSTKYLRTWVTVASTLEQEINKLHLFVDYLEIQ